mmetsp:Transcript_78584/g.138829  ORF Transcript_78584/g.138829 Transcript_78584/m.138829 type:complete len:204 (-) Transcript_78584:46-657(-)
MYDTFGNYVGPELNNGPKKKKRKRNQQVAVAEDADGPTISIPDPFAVTPDPEASLSSPFFTTLKQEAGEAESFGQKEDEFIPKVPTKDDWVNPKLNPYVAKDTNVMGACSYHYDEGTEIAEAAPTLAPVAKEAADRAREAAKEEREMQRNRRALEKEKSLALKKMSFNQREGRKRDLGQQSGDKNFIEEEKRILRQQFGQDAI